METKANYALAGFFIVAAFLSVVIFILCATRLNNKKPMRELDIYINGSVTGLTEGSKVLFNGINIGEVKQLVLARDNLNMVIAHSLVDITAPIRPSTIAELSYTGFTGAAAINLQGGKLSDPLLFSIANEKTPHLYAQAASINKILTSSQAALAQANVTLLKLNKLIDQVSTPMRQTIDNTRAFTDTLRSNRGNIQTMIVQSNKTLKALENAAHSVQAGIAPLSGGLSSITGTNLKSVQQKLIDGARSVERLERSINEIKRNPQRLIWGGGDSIPRL